MIVNVAALIAGAWWLQQQPLLPDLTGAAVLVPLVALWLLTVRSKGAAAGLAARAVALAGFAIAGFFWSAAMGHWSLAHALPDTWEGRDIELSGIIAVGCAPSRLSQTSPPSKMATTSRFAGLVLKFRVIVAIFVVPS